MMTRLAAVLLSACCVAALSGCKLDAVFSIDVADLSVPGKAPNSIEAKLLVPLGAPANKGTWIPCHSPEFVAVMERYLDNAQWKSCSIKSVKTIEAEDETERTEETLLAYGSGSILSLNTTGDRESRYPVAYIEASVPLLFEGSRPQGLFSLMYERVEGQVRLKLLMDVDAFSDMLHHSAGISAVTSTDSEGKKYSRIDVGNLDIAIFNSTTEECRVTAESAPERSETLRPGESRTYRIHANSSVDGEFAVVVDGRVPGSFPERLDGLRVDGCI